MAVVLWTFVPVAVLLSLTPGPGMALVLIRNAAAGGRPDAAGNQPVFRADPTGKFLPPESSL